MTGNKLQPIREILRKVRDIAAIDANMGDDWRASDLAIDEAEKNIQDYVNSECLKARIDEGSKIRSLANELANDDPEMKGSEYLRNYHYWGALDKRQLKLTKQLTATKDTGASDE